MPMDEAQHYREQAAELRKSADSALNDIMRHRLLKNATSCEQMAVALETIVTAVRTHAKLTVPHPDRPLPTKTTGM
jgi:hypothetical protein